MILVDTGGVLAAVDPKQTHHMAAAYVLRLPRRRIMSPFVLAELDYLIVRNAGQEQALSLLNDVARGAYQLESFDSSDIAAAIAVINRYAALNLGLADASIVILAERYQCADILTLDQRHFRTVLGPGGKPFRLLPLDVQ
jgi:predicted nucleic acid-binding protein